jgi:hypothetical protein
MAFTYNDEVVDLLLKKTLGTSYTSSTLVPGQETPLLQRIQNNQIFGRPLTEFSANLFDWSSPATAVTGGGTVSLLEYVHGEANPEMYSYIKKYEEIPMSVVAGTNNRAWKPTESSIQEKFKNVILGKPNFLFSLTTNITNYETILSSNSTFKPIINNGVLVFLGNSIPTSTNVVKMKEVYIYEGAFGAASGLQLSDLTDVAAGSPGVGQPLLYNNTSKMWTTGIIGRDYIPIDKLNDLTDVTTTGIQNKETLIYDSNDQTYKPGSIPENLNDLQDVTISSTPSVYDGLVYDGTTWKPTPVSAPVTGLDFLPDVDISSNLLADNKSILYDAASQKWKVGSVQLPISSINDLPDVDTTGVISKYALGWNASESKWKPQEVGDVIRGLGDLRDVDLGNLGTEIPQWGQVKKIEAADGGENDNFGTACAMDISFSVVSAYRTSATIGGQPATYVGSAYIFKRGGDSSTWSDHEKLAPDSPGFGMKFGSSISIRNNYIAIGAPSHSYTDGSTYTEAGSIFLFNYDDLLDTYGVEKDAGVTPPLYKEDSILRPTSPTNYNNFGADVDISGIYMIVGAPQPDTTDNGNAYVFKHDGTNWNQLQILTASDGAANDQFGHSVAINNSFAFVGTRRHNGYRGAVYIYKRNEGGSDNWGGGTQFQKITISDSSPYDYFGTDIACYGNDLIATAPKSTDKPGEAYLISLNLAQGYWGTDVGSGAYNETNIVREGVRTKSNNDGFGSSIQMGPSYGIVGASLSDLSGNDSGAAFVLQNTGEGYWEVLKNIRADDLQAGDEFGISVGMFDRYATVGAWKEDEPNNAGAAYIFNVPELEGGTRCLVYDQDTSRWKVGIVTSSGSGVFVSQLDDLTDVEVSGNKLGDMQAIDGQGLVYDQANKRWIPGDVQTKLTALGDVPGVVTTGLTSGHSLIYDGTNWNAAAVQASINSINDIPGVDIGNTGNNQALGNGQALVYNDVSGGWVNGTGSGGGGSASGVSTDNKLPDNPENGNIYYDTSRNAFYGYMNAQWLQFLMQSTPYLIGHPPILRNPPGIGFDTPYADRIEFSWEIPKQFPVGLKPTDDSDKVDGTLYLPAINKITFGYCLGNTYETANAIGGEIEIGGKSVNNRVVDQSSIVKNQKLYNSSGNNKLTNKLILYTTGSAVVAGLTNWNSKNSNFESDWIQTDANGNQVYYCNPRSTNFSITAAQSYTFRFYLSNSLASTDYNYKDITTSSLQVAVPTAVFTKTSTENGWYTEIIRDGDVHKLKVIIHNSALKHSSVSVTTSSTTDGVFFEAFEVQYRSVNAVDNINNENDAITWSAWSNVGFDAPNTSGIDDNKTIPQTTPLSSPANTTTNPYKLITIPQNDNKFYQIQVRAKNQLGVNFGPWSTSYTVRFTKPPKVAWNIPQGITTTGIIDTQTKFNAINTGDTIYMYLADGTLVAGMEVLNKGGNLLRINTYTGWDLKWDSTNNLQYFTEAQTGLKKAVTDNGGTWPAGLDDTISATGKTYLQDNGLGAGEVGWYLRTQEQIISNGHMVFIPTVDKWKMRVKWTLPNSSEGTTLTSSPSTTSVWNQSNLQIREYRLSIDRTIPPQFTFPGVIDTQTKFNAINTGDTIYMYLADGTLVAGMEVLNKGGNLLRINTYTGWDLKWDSTNNLQYFTEAQTGLKKAVTDNGGTWPTGLDDTVSATGKTYLQDNGLGGGDVGWYLRTQEKQPGTGSYTIVDHIAGTTDSGIIQYDYVLANSSDVEEGVKSESQSRASYTGTHSNKRTNPSFSFKIEARNYLFGNSGNENQWSVISEVTSIVTPSVPDTPVHDVIKFYEQGKDDGQFDPPLPDDDYVAYQWYEPNNIGATGLSIDVFKVAFNLGYGSIDGTSITFANGTDELNIGDKIIISSNSNIFQSNDFTNTEYTVSSLISAVVTLSSSTGITASKYLFKIQYIPVTDKVLGGDPFYKRIYKAANVAGNPGSFDYCVEAINYFNSSWSSGFVKPTALTPGKPDPFNIDTNRPVVQILNNDITINVDEPVNTTTSYSDGTNYDPHSLSMGQCQITPTIGGTQKNNILVFPTASGSPIVISFLHTKDLFMSGTGMDLKGTNGIMSFSMVGKNVLNGLNSVSKSIGFTINKPAPSQFSQAPLFEWTGVNGTNEFKLTLRVGNPGANFIQGGGTSPNYVASTYAPITNSNTGDLQLTPATHIKNATNALQWNIKYSASTGSAELNSELGTSGSWGDPKYNGSYNNGDYVITNIGDLVENTTYTISYRCRNKYNENWLTQNSPEIKMKKPNLTNNPTGTITIPGANADRSAGEVTISLDWDKPTQPGFFHKHNNEGSLTADPNYPNIYQYQVELWPYETGQSGIAGALDFSTTNYTASDTNNATFQFRAKHYNDDTTNGGADPIDIVNFESKNTLSNGFTGITSDTTLENATVGGNSNTVMTIHPDHKYKFRVKATNWYFKSSFSDPINTLVTSVSVPKTIAGSNCVIRSGYIPTLNATTANYTSSATASHYGLYNSTNNTASNLASIPINLTGLDSVYSSSPGQVILNQQYYRPQSNNFLKLQFNFGSDSSEISRNKDTNQYSTLPGSKAQLDFGTGSDIYEATHSCATRWYKGTQCKFVMVPGQIGALNDTVLGQSIDVNMKFIYLAGGASLGPNGASQSETTITSTIASSKYFDKCNVLATFSTDPVWTYTPFKCYGLPILLSRGSGSQTLQATYTVDNKSKYFVMTNYIIKVNIGDKTNTIEKILGAHTKEAWDTTAGTASGTADKFKLTGQASNFGFTVNQDKSYSNGTRATFTLNNIVGQNAIGDKGIKFIYDDDTLEFIANNNSYGTANISSTGSDAVGSGQPALTKIKVPDNFNMGSDTGSSLTNENWGGGVITASDTCVGQPKLVIHRGKFMSGGYFKSSGGLSANTPTVGDYHSDVTTFWNDYDASSTDANLKHTRTGSGITGTTHDETYKNNFRWCMYEYLVTNTSASPWSGLTNFSIKLGDSNNTNIAITDIISSSPSNLDGGTTFNCEIFYKFILIKSDNTLDFEGRWWKAVVGEQSLANSGTTPASVATAVGESFNSNNGAAVLIEPPSNNTTWVNGGRRLIFSVKSHGCKQNEKIRIIIAIGLKNYSSLFIKDVFRGSSTYNDGTVY